MAVRRIRTFNFSPACSGMFGVLIMEERVTRWRVDYTRLTASAILYPVPTVTKTVTDINPKM
jgi:hypothetical protein